MRTIQKIQTFGFLACLSVAWSASAMGQESIPWAKDLRTAQETAAQQKRLVLLHFWAPNCPPCQTVERYVFTHPEVVRAIGANYVPLYVNAQALPEVAKSFGVDRWPTDVIITPAGEVLSRTVSPKDAREYTALVNRVAAERGMGQGKWGELAQNPRQPPPTYQASEYQTAGEAKTGAFAGGDYQGAPPPYQPSRPTETTSGFGQYNAAPATPNSRNLAGGANSPGKGFPAYNGNPYLDVAPPRGPDSERTALEQAGSQPNGNQFPAAGGVPEGVVNNPQYQPGGSRQEFRAEPGNSPAASGGSFGAGTGGDFSAGGDPVAQEWNPDNRQPSPRGNGLNDLRGPDAPGARGPDYRQVTSESSINEPAAKSEKPMALDGFCPVTLVQSQQWKRGTAEFGAVHRGRTYLFVGQREQAAFLADPDRYSPVLSGYDPVKYRERGEFIEGKRQFGVFYGEQIFLFADKAARQQFEASPDSFAKEVHQAMLQNAVGNRLR